MIRPEKRLRVCVVGSGTRFLSGISYYTLRLANALTCTFDVSAILMRQLLPTPLYPGRARVGASLTRQQYRACVAVFDGVDWYWLPSLLRALGFLVRQRPDVLVFQWWTGTTLHTYLMLALVARLLGARCIIEFHEVLDTGEARLPLVQAYVRLLMPLLIFLANGFVVHSAHDLPLLKRRYRIGEHPFALIPHGPYDHYEAGDQDRAERVAPAACCNLLYFGVIRPYKGVEDLVRAFDAIPEDAIQGYWLTIVGETWEGWMVPAELIAQSRYRERISFINRYVRDEEVARFFAEADAVVLPYHRSSASGPLHIAMSRGLPIVTTRVGGLPEAVQGYSGAVLVPPCDVPGLSAALLQIGKLKGQRFVDPHSWAKTVTEYERLFVKTGLSPSQWEATPQGG